MLPRPQPSVFQGQILALRLALIIPHEVSPSSWAVAAMRFVSKAPRVSSGAGGAPSQQDLLFLLLLNYFYSLLSYTYTRECCKRRGTVRTSFAVELFIIIIFYIVVIICYYIPSQRESADVLRTRTRWCHLTRSAGSRDRDPRLSLNIY